MKKFLVLWISQAISMFGSSVVGFALAWYLTKETGSATILATSMMVAYIPGVVLGPFIGPLIDRWNRKKIMIFSDLSTMLLTLVLVVLFYSGTIQIWHIYVVMAGRAVGGCFQGPALNASLPMIVPEKHMVRANGLNMTLHGVINIAGPPAGALLIEALPMQWVLSVDIITAVIAIGCLLPLAIPQPPRTTLAVKFSVIEDMVQGFRYVAAWKGLLFLIIIFAIINLFAAPLISLLPLFVTNYLGGDVLKFGWLVTAFGVGIVAGGLILSAWGGFKRKIITSFMGFIISCIANIIFGFTTESLFFLGLSMMLLSGLSNTLGNGPIFAILQTTVVKDMQGRVFTLVGSISGAMIPLGLAITGPVANVISLRTIWYGSGAAMIVLLMIGLFSRSIMSIENHKVEEKGAEEAAPEVENATEKAVEVPPDSPED